MESKTKAIMNWIKSLLPSRPKQACHGAVVFLDTDVLSAEDIERIKQRLTPVFVEFSGRSATRCCVDVSRAVTSV